MGGRGEGKQKGKRKGEGAPGGGRTYLLLALVIWPLTKRPFRDGAPFLPLIETPPTFGRSLRRFHVLHTLVLCLLVLSPFLFGRLYPPSIS